MKIVLLLIPLALFASACHPSRQDSKPPRQGGKVEDSRQAILEAHHSERWKKQPAIGFELELFFRGELRLNAQHEMTTATDLIRMEYSDGKTILFDGSGVRMRPDSVHYPRARFDIFTWSYFFALPFKLDDPGTQWEDLGTLELNGKSYNAGKLTFGEEVGDAPDDWYIVYSDPESHLVHAAAYIVTYSKSQKKAEEDPHAIIYHDYKTVDGVPIASRWTFHSWQRDSGLTDTLGRGTIRDIRFMELPPERPADVGSWKKVEAPK